MTEDDERSKKMELKDSGTRSQFETGAVRDGQTGKGRFDLLPADALERVATQYGDGVWLHSPLSWTQVERAIVDAGLFVEYACVSSLVECVGLLFAALSYPAKPGRLYESCYSGIEAVAKVFELGAAKYAARNWEKGIPTHRFVDSGLRHAMKHLAGWTDEPHLAQATWNFLCLLQTQLWIQDGTLPASLQTLPMPRQACEALTSHGSRSHASEIGEACQALSI
jgi:hypothetical protein